MADALNVEPTTDAKPNATVTSTRPSATPPAARGRSSKSSSTAVVSGCTWHVHHDSRDLVNLRPTNETIDDAAGIERSVEAIGDLPVLARDNQGAVRRVLIRDVRVVPHFKCTLLSVDLLWQNSRIDAFFRDTKALQAPAAGGSTVKFPFQGRYFEYKYYEYNVVAKPVR